MEVRVEMKNTNEENCRPFFLFGGRHLTVSDQNGRQLDTENDGIEATEINGGFSYIWPQDKIQPRSKFKNRRENNLVKFEVVSLKEVTQASAKVFIGDFPPLNIDLNFGETP